MGTLGALAATTASLRACLIVLEEVSKKALLVDDDVRACSGPEATSGYFQRAFFIYLYPMLMTGFRQNLTLEDMGKLGIKYSSKALHLRLKTNFDRTQASKSRFHLVCACFLTWKWELVLMAIPRFANIGACYAQPFLLGLVIDSAEADGNEEGDRITTAMRAGTVAATFLIFMVQAITTSASRHFANGFVTQVRGGLVAEMMEKTHRLSEKDAKNSSVLTHTSSDIESIAMGLASCVDIPITFIELGFGVYLLSRFIEQSCFFVLLPVMGSSLFSFLLGLKTGPLMAAWNKSIEIRVSKTSQVLHQLPEIKMMGLGPVVRDKIHNSRIEEMRTSRPYRFWMAILNMTTSLTDVGTPVVVMAAAYFWRGFGHRMSSDQVFPTLAIVALIQNPTVKSLQVYTELTATYLPESLHVIDQMITVDSEGHVVLDEDFASDASHAQLMTRLLSAVTSNVPQEVEDKERASIKRSWSSNRPFDAAKYGGSNSKSSWRLYMLFINSVGKLKFTSLSVLAFFMAASELIPEIYLRIWTDSAPEDGSWFGWYAFMAVAASAITGLTYWVLYTVVANTPQERRPASPEQLPPVWPYEGFVELTGVSSWYKPEVDMPPIVRDVSLLIDGGEKIGLFGRTGSGKSSLLLTLLGHLSYEGTVEIDGVDIANIDPDALRAHIITITQHPVQFDDTIRANLLPFEMNDNRGGTTDEQNRQRAAKDAILISLLERFHLWSKVRDRGGLDAMLTDVGYSKGEIQLLSIARAIVRRQDTASNLVLVDEATSNLDPERDTETQAIMDEAFAGCTVLTVAHRLETIQNVDCKIEMTAGKLTQFIHSERAIRRANRSSSN
ncbi:multidrug resistance protein MDR [Cordyceps javanica]|uniref:Multidrug resistance protein MDR n=1 Tax=Cordyceps javanica TaxID=43265 RepID=A0A545UKR0_9HYPO|nr:multidrug resistance protein MDR [Cordyceps javanica]TQW01537.1 multidrug resistance protein MDR [Cordyceps javanica]